MQKKEGINRYERDIKRAIKSDDIEYTKIKTKEIEFELIFIKSCIDKKMLGEGVIKPMESIKEGSISEIENNIILPEKKKLKSIKQAIKEIVCGNVVMIISGKREIFSFEIKKLEGRAISEPPTSTVIKGPREGFVEELEKNCSLMRRRLKSPLLTFYNIEVGRYTNTKVSLCYIKGIAREELVEEIKEKIKKIEIKAVLDSSYISKHLGERKHSLSPAIVTSIYLIVVVGLKEYFYTIERFIKDIGSLYCIIVLFTLALTLPIIAKHCKKGKKEKDERA